MASDSSYLLVDNTALPLILFVDAVVSHSGVVPSMPVIPTTSVVLGTQEWPLHPHKEMLLVIQINIHKNSHWTHLSHHNNDNISGMMCMHISSPSSLLLGPRLGPVSLPE